MVSSKPEPVNYWDSKNQKLTFTIKEFARLEHLADPFLLNITKIATAYQFSIANAEYGYTKRIVAFQTLSQEKDHFLMASNMIGDMKKELLTSRSPNPRMRSDVWLDLREEKRKEPKLQPKPEPKLVHISCPVHGNPMMRRSEDDPRLYCTVYGCTKRAKPKALPEPVVEPAEEVATVDSGGSAAETILGVDLGVDGVMVHDFKDSKNFQKALGLIDGTIDVEDLVESAEEEVKRRIIAAVQSLPRAGSIRCNDGKARTPDELVHYSDGIRQGFKDAQTVSAGFKGNDRAIRFHTEKGRYYLVQSTGDIEVWIDITGAQFKMERDMYGMTDEVTIRTVH